MPVPSLYQRYERQEAIALYGSEADAQTHCDGQWVIFPEVTLCFYQVGNPPRLSHFRNAGEFCWVADKPNGSRTCHMASSSPVKSSKLRENRNRSTFSCATTPRWIISMSASFRELVVGAEAAGIATERHIYR